MESVESNIGNTKQSLYDGIRPENIYYSAFDDDPEIYDVVLPCSQEINIKRQKKFMKHMWKLWKNT